MANEKRKQNTELFLNPLKRNPTKCPIEFQKNCLNTSLSFVCSKIERFLTMNDFTYL